MRLIDVKREQMLDGMEAIIRRLCRVGPRGDLVLMYDEYSPRELAIKLLCFVEGRDPEIIDEAGRPAIVRKQTHI